ncbi:tripartite tricarboxylate transporter substrate binding protein [Propionivibrio soli]|uniref:tripartite tricarboxylate transporter substrate binding protein n=1 Tax=Propionivibrio soli TaxID=2976531 RepID=UPI0021E78E01|nr:tripartite tricarboxylate transporter substrate binding protein [Propionivibrio soli]
MKHKLLAALLPAFLLTAGFNAKAADEPYPQKPIVAIVAFPAGGGTDIIARSIFRTAEKYVGKGFVVDNKPGAGGAIGFTAIAGAPKDGYTLGFINAPTIVLNPIQLADKVKYKLDDFVPIANFVSDPGVFAVNVDSPFKTFKDFVDYAKANPNKVKLAYGGPGTSEALALRNLEQKLDIKFRKVPFEGTGPQLTALMGGHIDIMISNASEIYPQVEAKTIRVIAVGSEKRVDLYPNAPTYKESGFDYTQVSMRGLAAPKGVDAKHVKFLADAMKKSFEDPEFRKHAQELHLPLQYMGPEELAKELARQDAFYRAEYAKSPW